MGLTEYLAMIFYDYSDYMCYGAGALILAVMYAIFKDGGIPKPKKEDIFPFVKKILQYFQERKGK